MSDEPVQEEVRPGGRRRCACPCGEWFQPSHERQKYVDANHGMRAYRRRVREAAKAAGLPPSISLAEVEKRTGTRMRTSPPNGEAESRRRRAQRRSSDSIRVSFRRGELETVLGVFSGVVELEDVEPEIAARIVQKAERGIDRASGS